MNPLSPCPKSPNCTRSGDGPGEAPPIPMPASANSVEHAAQLVREAVMSMRGAQLVQDQGARLGFVFRSRFLGFHDDVDLFIDWEAKQIHFRSASRTGWWDLGVNRRRMKRIRALLKDQE